MALNLGAFERKTVAAAGFDVTYYEAGSGVPLVVVPGAGGPQLGPAFELLAEQFRVITLELPGWGMQPNDVADMQGLAEQVVEVATALGLDTFHLQGTSLGGACALHVAMTVPDRVISLTLEAPAWLRAESVNPAELPPEKFVPAFRTHPERGVPMAPLDPEFMQRVWPTVMRVLADGELTEGFAERMRNYQGRTLVMFGVNDGIINPINGRTYRNLMPNCVLMYVYDAAHETSQDRPEMFADVVSDFVRRGMNFLVKDSDALINP